MECGYRVVLGGENATVYRSYSGKTNEFLKGQSPVAAEWKFGISCNFPEEVRNLDSM